MNQSALFDSPMSSSGGLFWLMVKMKSQIYSSALSALELSADGSEHLLYFCYLKSNNLHDCSEIELSR